MDMERKSEPDSREQGWSLSAFIAYALEALAAVKRKKKIDDDMRPRTDQK
jgi:hypothetical protein